MDLKKMSGEDLVSRVISKAFVSKSEIEVWNYLEHKDELLSRLSRLEELEKQAEKGNTAIKILERILRQIKANTHCNGLDAADFGCTVRCMVEDWQSDNLSAEERKVQDALRTQLAIVKSDNAMLIAEQDANSFIVSNLQAVLATTEKAISDTLAELTSELPDIGMAVRILKLRK
jgi:TFIIF-interacting CTD phosphatase-like protein